MSRDHRLVHGDPFAATTDFNEQLVQGLRQAPWWMISVAIHVFVFVVASLLLRAPGTVEPPKQVVLSADRVLEDEPEEPDEPIDPIRPQDLPQEIPILPPTEILPVESTENLLPDHGDLGEDGIDESGITGPGNNPYIGLGGGVGGPRRGPFGGRADGGPAGGGGPFRPALEDALRWLAAHQSPDGGWEAAGFHRWCDGQPYADGPDGAGRALYDPGVTGLAVCAFLGAGYTNRGNHEFAKVVGKALRYLKNIQDAEGCFGPRTGQHYIYNHATAALAMVEAYGMTESPIYRVSAQKALDFIAVARNPYFAWRYGVKPGENDTSVTGWMMMALKSAKLVNEDAVARGHKAPLVIDEEAFDGIRTWIAKMTDPDTGRTGYIQRGGQPARPQHLLDRFPGDRSESTTGVALLARVFAGEDPRRSEIIRKGTELCLRVPPKWDPEGGTIDMYYWYYATLAMYQVGGAAWKTWEAAMKPAMVDTQRRDTDFCRYKGSWDPIGPWGEDGGRVYATAVMAMCLEAYYRYGQVFGTRVR